jgi:type VI secretion system secreted protein Hcp
MIHGAVQGAFKGQGEGAIRTRSPGWPLHTAWQFPKILPLDFALESASISPLFSQRNGVQLRLYQAAATNEVLKSVLFEFITTNTYGKEEVDFTIELTNAMISGFEGSLHIGEKAGPIIDTRELEVITLEFQKIVVTSVTGGTTASDNWSPSL